ncbi:prepilin-type N-terminal cleavage/methylation domain-containing protein [Candidatus Pacearchaeota archaeon]|nr:prepilin-type N-terminal cleavage/methylation domain-containing protein [Candidatus Pacearchaeota archaeon]
MKLIKKNKRGETILETIIAMVILAVGVTTAGAIIGYSLRNMNGSKNRIIAINIAREGVEAVRNIRDTNWLKYNSRRRVCWNHMPEIDPEIGCDGSTPIQPGRYLIYKQAETERWILTEYEIRDDEFNNTTIPDAKTTGLNYYYNTDTNRTYRKVDEKWEDIATLHLMDIDATWLDSDEDHIYDNDEDLFNHAYNPNDNLDRETVHDSLGEKIVKKTALKRIISIDYLQNDGDLIFEDNGSTTVSNLDDRMRITSIVSWQEGNRNPSVELVTHITDYLGRESFNN